MEYRPRIVSWNITSSCNLRCPHCYLSAGHSYPDELTTDEGLGLIDQMAEAGTELLILTGGEPLLRKDLPILAHHAAHQHIQVVLGTNGTALNRDTARALRENGVAGVGVGLDSLDPGKHDNFRGVPGAWGRAVQGIEACTKEGLGLLIHTTALKINCEEIPGMIQFAYDSGAQAFHLFFLVCTGRGEQLSDLSPEDYERLLSVLLDCQKKYPRMMMRARCAPYIRRLAHERGADLLWSAGCLAGTSYCRVTPTGDVTPCPYIPTVVGSVRRDRFNHIWETSPALASFQLPQRQLKGKCSECPFSRGDEPICVGCRARALALTGDALAADPWCLYQPGRPDHLHDEGKTFFSQQEPVPWTKEALERMRRIPFFIRGRVKEAAEAYVRQKGLPLVTSEVLEELRRHHPTNPTRSGGVPRAGKKKT